MLIHKIRPHHGLCITFFEGKGYNSEFINNMAKIIQTLNANSQVQLVKSVDSICIACPHNINNICTKNEKVNHYDSTIMELCNLKIDQLLLWKEFKDLIFTNIIKKNKLNFVCGDCSWNMICAKKISKY